MTFCKWNCVHLNIDIPKKEKKNLYKKLYSLTCCNFNKIAVGQLNTGTLAAVKRFWKALNVAKPGSVDFCSLRLEWLLRNKSTVIFEQQIVSWP